MTARQSLGADTVADRRFAESEVARWQQVGAEAELALGLAKTRLAQLVALPEIELPDPGKAQAPVLRWTSEEAMLSHVTSSAPSAQHNQVRHQHRVADLQR